MSGQRGSGRTNEALNIKETASNVTQDNFVQHTHG